MKGKNRNNIILCSEFSQNVQNQNYKNRCFPQKQSVAKQLEELKASLEEESRLRAKYQHDARNAQSELEQLRDQLDEEVEGRADAQRMLTKANNEMQVIDYFYVGN